MQAITIYANPRNIGQTASIEGMEVVYCDGGSTCDIEFQKYTKDYSDYSARPFIVTSTNRRYASLVAAVKAIKKIRG